MIYFLLLTLLLSSCITNKTNKQRKPNYFEAKKKYKKLPNIFTPDIYIQTKISSQSEESVFLDDIDFIVTKNSKGNVIAKGKRLFKKNNVSNELFSFDNLALMQQKGHCRSQLALLMNDLYDNPFKNDINVNHVDTCLPNGKMNLVKNEMSMSEVSFLDLNDWAFDDFEDAMVSFLNNCKNFNSFAPMKSQTISIGSEADWSKLCVIAQEYYKIAFTRMFFERYFSPFKIYDNTKDIKTNTITGYYVWELDIDRKPSKDFWYPIYKTPIECKANSSCYSREEINNGSLVGKNLEIAFASNPMDVYFMQVQGSGIGIMPDKTQIRFNFGGKNGFEYSSFMNFIKKNPNFCPYTNYADISDWLYINPNEAIKATNVSQSYVFFQESDITGGVYGSFNVPLTQSRSVAIDPKYIPYGMPIWIETSLPIIDTNYNNKNTLIEFNRLYMAQDTGAAIKGIGRADLYMGHGKKGEFIAKNMKFQGTSYILIPNAFINLMQ